MKDIIDELIEQAYVEVPHERDEGFTQQFDKRLFAKLVAVECVNVCNDGDSQYHIKHLFGIK